jgi:hypothetical protein
MKNIPGGHNLFVQDQGVSKLIENVYSKVIHFLGGGLQQNPNVDKMYQITI